MTETAKKIKKKETYSLSTLSYSAYSKTSETELRAMINIVVKLHNMNPKKDTANILSDSSTKLLSVLSLLRWDGAIAIAQNGEDVVILGQSSLSVLTSVIKDIKDKKLISPVYPHYDRITPYVVLMDDFSDNEMSVISRSEDLISRIYVTRKDYDEIIGEKEKIKRAAEKIRRLKEEEFNKAQLILQRERKEREKRIVQKATKCLRQYKKFGKFKYVRENTEDKTVLIIKVKRTHMSQVLMDTVTRKAKQVFAISFAPIPVTQYLKSNDIIPPYRSSYLHVEKIISCTLDYYLTHFNLLPCVTLKIYNFDPSITPIANKIMIKFETDDGNVKINNMPVRIYKLNQALAYIRINLSSIDHRQLTDNITFDNDLKVFLNGLSSYSTEQIEVLANKSYYFELQPKIPFDVGVDKKGWYIQFRKKYYLKWSAPDKKDVKHVLAYARNDRNPYRVSHVPHLIRILSGFFPMKDDEIIKYIKQIQILENI